MKRTRSLVLILLILIVAALLIFRFRGTPAGSKSQDSSPTEEITAHTPDPQEAEPTDEESEEDEPPVVDEYVVELEDDEVIEIG